MFNTQTTCFTIKHVNQLRVLAFRLIDKAYAYLTMFMECKITFKIGCNLSFSLCILIISRKKHTRGW